MVMIRMLGRRGRGIERGGSLGGRKAVRLSAMIGDYLNV